MITESLTVNVAGSEMPSYLARPEGTQPRPAVIVLQEIFGVNTEVKRITDLLAESGYVALAINYYHRTHPDLNEPDTDEGLREGFAAAGRVSRATLREDVGAAADWLAAQPYVKDGRIATWGFCFGGSVAFVTATLPQIKAAIAFYGGSIGSGFPNGEAEGLADVASIDIPLLLAFGGQDEYITPEIVGRIERTLAEHHHNARVKVYPHQGHAFFRDSRRSLEDPTDPRSADVADAWTSVRAFLSENLGA